jgi:hypothetical protein
MSWHSGFIMAPFGLPGSLLLCCEDARAQDKTRLDATIADTPTNAERADEGKRGFAGSRELNFRMPRISDLP